MGNDLNESSMLLEIRRQGEVLARVLSRCKEEINRIVEGSTGTSLHLVGCGDMYFAAAQVQAIAEASWGGVGRAWRSMDIRWVHRRLGEDDLVVCASVSGRTPRTLEAALLARQAGARAVGITDNPGSPLDAALEETLILGTAPRELLEDKSYPGYRNIIAQTQTFTAVLVVELALAAALRGEVVDLTGIARRVEELAGMLEDPAREVAEAFFAGGEHVVVLGSGPHWPVACYGAAKMLEFAVPATAQCIEEFNHLEAFVSDQRTRLLVLAADEQSKARATELTGAWERIGVRSLVLARDDAFPGQGTRVLRLPCRDLLDQVLCQVIALQLLTACGVAVMGRDPNRWLGGRRTEQVQAMSQQTIRGSRLWQP